MIPNFMGLGEKMQKVPDSLVLVRQIKLIKSIFLNPSALPHALTLLTAYMGRGEFIDKNAH